MKINFKAILLSLLALSISACTMIGTGEVGVKTTYGGKIDLDELSQGFHFTMPLLVDVDVFTYKEVKMNLTDKAFLPVSSENQEVDKFDAEIYYQMNPSKVADVKSKYEHGDKKIGPYIAPSYDFVYSKGRSVSRSVVSKYNSLDITASREEIQSKIKIELQSSLDDAVPDTFIINDVIVRDIKPNKKIADSAAKNVNKANEAEAVEKDLGIAETQRLINETLSSSLTPQVLEMRRLDIDEKRIEMMRHACSSGRCTFFIDSDNSKVVPTAPLNDSGG